MKKASRMATSPRSNWRYGMMGKFSPNAWETPERISASELKTAIPATDAVSRRLLPEAFRMNDAVFGILITLW